MTSISDNELVQEMETSEDNKKRHRSETSNAASRESSSSPSAKRRATSSSPVKTETNTAGNDEVWLNDIQKKVIANAGEEWEDEDWTDFSVEVARYLRKHGRRNKHIIRTLVGLFKLRVDDKESLKSLADNKNDFKKDLDARGIGPGISAFLFDKYCDAGNRTNEVERTPRVSSLLTGMDIKLSHYPVEWARPDFSRRRRNG
eukprot:Nitzschia sp. Nitz4//scaffold887_size1287//505//1110//NITZ4_009325-RA/size1287-processed-gene-0.1-mRNA-1//-1//CDS//3329559446//1115//frame0